MRQFPLPVPPFTRRELLKCGAFGLGLASFWPIGSLAQAPRRVTRLLMHYRTDPERIARLLPPPLEPAAEPSVWVEYVVAELADAGQASGITPAVLGWSGFFIAARHGEQLGLFPAGLWTSHEWGRMHAREFLGLNAKPAEIVIERKGDSVRAQVSRYERPLHSLATAIASADAVDSEATGSGGLETTGHTALHQDLSHGIFSFRCRLHPDWTQGPLEGGNVELLQLEASDDSAANAPVPVVCSTDETILDWQAGTPLDPAVELPVERVLAVSLAQQDGGSLLELPRQVSAPRVRAQIPAADFEPWALTNYERPVSIEEPWMPPGWRQTTSAARLTREELETYRGREELRLESADIVDIQLVAQREAFDNLLPVPIQPGLRLRVMALRAENTDLSPAPFNEVWLFAYGLLGNRPVWYALSHVAGPSADLTMGRETFGYPSRRGDIEVVTTPIDFYVLGRRKGRDFFFAQGTIQGMATGLALGQIDTACLRVGPFGGPEPRGQFIAQSWYYQGQRAFIDRASLAVEAPGEAGLEGVLSDPWFEFNPFRVVSVFVTQRGAMQRTPAEVLGDVPGEFLPFYAERCDGLLPGGPPDAVRPPSFHVRSSSATRSALRSNQI